MKVKLFWKNAPVGNGDKNARAFEDEINAWLSESPRIKIIDIRQSSSGGSFGSSLWFVSVWYEEAAGEPAAAPDRPHDWDLLCHRLTPTFHYEPAQPQAIDLRPEFR